MAFGSGQVAAGPGFRRFEPRLFGTWTRYSLLHRVWWMFAMHFVHADPKNGGMVLDPPEWFIRVSGWFSQHHFERQHAWAIRRLRRKSSAATGWVVETYWHDRSFWALTENGAQSLGDAMWFAREYRVNVHSTDGETVVRVRNLHTTQCILL